jgi:hypothetical protein
MRELGRGESIGVRNPAATRPWQPAPPQGQMVPGRLGPPSQGSDPISVTVKRVGEAVEVLLGASSLPEGQEVVLFTSSDLKNLDRERRAEVDLQMPSFGNPANLTFTRPTCRRHRKPGSPFPLRFRPSPHESTCTIQPEHNQAHTAAVPQNRPPPPASGCGDESTGSSISPTHQLKRTCC